MFEPQPIGQYERANNTIPKLIVKTRGFSSTDIEIYLSRSLGLSLSVLGLIVLFFTGTIPLSSSIAGPAIRLDELSTTNDPKAPYAVPILRVTALFHFSCAVYCYMRYVNVAQTGFLLGCVGYGALACMGSVSDRPFSISGRMWMGPLLFAPDRLFLF